jgi:GT2 family glycosyltransferase
VITPCYNAEGFVAETIESVISQTYAPVEHIVVDDGSTDGSWSVVQRYAPAVTGLQLEQNGGGSRARNAGLERARGEFLVFLDADDLLSSDAIAALVTASRETPGDIVYCQWRRLRKIDGEWRKVDAEIPLPAVEVDPLSGWLNDRWVPPCAVLWPRSVYEATGGWDEEISFNDDADLMMRALATGVGLTRAAGGEAYYRALGTATESVSSGLFTERRCRSNLRVYEKLAAQLEELGRIEEFAPTIGYILQDQGSRAILEGYPELGRECLELAHRYGDPRRLAQTRSGHLLVKLIGVEGKERIAQGLARLGIMTAARRKVKSTRRSLERARTEVDSDSSHETRPSGSGTHVAEGR